MFKDYDKYLSASLRVYLFVLVIIFIMKLIGLDYFGIDVNNKTLAQLGSFIINNKIDYIWYFITIYFNTYIMISISINKFDTKCKYYSLIFTIINYINGYTIKNTINIIPFSFALDFLVLFIAILIYDKPNIKNNTKKFP